jgi:hypothetical protein
MRCGDRHPSNNHKTQEMSLELFPPRTSVIAASPAEAVPGRSGAPAATADRV